MMPLLLSMLLFMLMAMLLSVSLLALQCRHYPLQDNISCTAHT